MNKTDKGRTRKEQLLQQYSEYLQMRSYLKNTYSNFLNTKIFTVRKIFFICLILNSVYSFGQVGFSNQTITINGHQVEIVQSALFPDAAPNKNCPKLDTFEINLVNDTININYYYDSRIALLLMRCIQTDTIYIDSLPSGNYTLILL